MKLVYNEKFYGPIAYGTIIEVPSITNTEYTHIGIQVPRKVPINKIISDYTYNKENDITKTINDDIDINISTTGTNNNKGCDYRISDTGILEFENLGDNKIVITVKRSLPVETIIDVAKYER